MDPVARIRAAIKAAGDPVRAAEQQRYMKSAMPYRGISSPELRALLRPILADYRPAGREGWAHDVRELWDGATFREERYAATALARHRLARDWQDLESLGLYRHLVVTGAWWDHVDEIAAHLAGAALAARRPEVTPVLRDWARADDLWLRRTAVLAQLRHAADTDQALLRDVIEANLADPSFWLRKAIGWALRQYARTDPCWVAAEVDRLGDRLAPLSRREATKHLPPVS
ncbi:MAG: DNA alkylation repair protein [Nocardioides sp.]